jgi:hypothetical protein
MNSGSLEPSTNLELQSLDYQNLQLQLFKAKEGNKKYKAIRMLKYPRFANLALLEIALHVPALEL